MATYYEMEKIPDPDDKSWDELAKQIAKNMWEEVTDTFPDKKGLGENHYDLDRYMTDRIAECKAFQVWSLKKIEQLEAKLNERI